MVIAGRTSSLNLQFLLREQVVMLPCVFPNDFSSLTGDGSIIQVTLQCVAYEFVLLLLANKTNAQISPLVLDHALILSTALGSS